MGFCTLIVLLRSLHESLPLLSPAFLMALCYTNRHVCEGTMGVVKRNLKSPYRDTNAAGDVSNLDYRMTINKLHC